MTSSASLLLLVGMHRSGTSLLGSLLPDLDIALPGALLGGDRHNPEGYFERTDITELQENLLIHLGHWWPSQSGALPLAPGWQEHPAAVDAARQLGVLLDAELKRQNGPWAIKDPRTSLLLPLWCRLATERSLPLRLVLCLRDPAEVVTSLVERDREAAGMTPWRAQQLWWRHNCQILLDGQDLPLMVVDYDGWFDSPRNVIGRLRQLARFCGSADPSEAALQQALGRIRPQHRRSRRSRLRRLPVHPRLRWLERRMLALGEDGDRRKRLVVELTGAPRTLALPFSRWRYQQATPELNTPLDPTSHPWARAALALQGGHHGAARRQLQHWQDRGGPSGLDLTLISHAPARFFSTTPAEGPSPQGPAAIRAFAADAGWNDWPLHAWLQHLPLPLDPLTCRLLTADERCVTPPSETIALHLVPLSLTAERGWLAGMAGLGRVFDPDPQRVSVLRRLGISAAHMEREGPVNGWLQGAEDLQQSAARLGLPDPLSLGVPQGGILCLGSGGKEFERNLEPPFWCLPGFDRLRKDDPEEARLLAGWLDRVQRQGLQLVRIDPGEAEEHLDGSRALQPPTAPRPSWLPAQTFRAPLHPEALEEELRWWRDGCPPPRPCQTPAPEFETVYQRGEGPAAAAICVSLHNYADRILEALESARRQTLEDLELIVVDDASTDGGPQLVERWMQQHGERFRHCLLLRHRHNGGLSATRNRAFATTTAPWAFVLDADNQLLPEALEHVLGVARCIPPSAGVIHTLVEIRGEVRDPERPVLLHPMSWQREHFHHSNFIDAMVLVRVSAWEAVGGYVHIPGGWEDYDFWCLLIEAGFHGVLCPQRLAVYHQHGESMIASTTNRHIRRISRVLQARHPWLTLPWARPGW